MARNKYLTIKESSTVFDSLGNAYPDIMTFPINNFIYTAIPLKVILTSFDIDRFDLFSYNYYSTSDYTDILLWLNNIDSVHSLVEGQEFIVPELADINRFYLDNL